jgi:prolyl-tRNA editing enzyme YbaK/EbsC (Cys-tRNA(Pro) deacylase)
VREATGFAIGGIPPLGHATPITTFIDEALLGYELVWAAAGTPDAVFPIAPERLSQAIAARPIRVTAP